MSMNPVARDSLMAIAAAINPAAEESSDAAETAADFVKRLLAEPDKKKRKAMVKDFTARHRDVAKFLADNEELINAEAELALISAAVGGTVTEKEVSYKGGRRHVSTKEKHTAPNVAALNLYLKNKMPDKYSDKPQTEVEIEDVTEIEEELYGEDTSEGTEQKDDTV